MNSEVDAAAEPAAVAFSPTVCRINYKLSICRAKIVQSVAVGCEKGFVKISVLAVLGQHCICSVLAQEPVKLLENIL